MLHAIVDFIAAWYILLFIIFTCITCTSVVYSIILRKNITKLYVRHIEEIGELLALHEQEVKKHVAQSRRVLKGKISEELFPLLAGCPYLPADMKFFGSPIDYIILDGYSEAKDDGGDFREIIFADIKTGNARLSSHQKKIKAAVEAGRVRWETIRMLDDGSVIFERDETSTQTTPHGTNETTS